MREMHPVFAGMIYVGFVALALLVIGVLAGLVVK